MSGSNVAKERRLLWLSKVREFLSRQASILQKMKDDAAVKAWRHDNRSFEKSMDKAARRNEDDIPFAIDIEDYVVSSGQKIMPSKQANSRSKENLAQQPPANINRKIRQLLESLNQLQIARSSAVLTPRSEQKFLADEIEKISRLQEEVQYLKKYNDVTTAPVTEN